MMSQYDKLMSDAPLGKGFYTDFGEIKNLAELKAAISERGNDFYSAYAKDGTNHFANWTESVFGDHELANELRNADLHHKAVKAIDDKLKYAELSLAYGQKAETINETLNDYLTNGEFSIKQVMNSPEFSPEHHRFETVFDMDLHSITKAAPPKTTFLLNFSSVLQDKQEADLKEQDVLKNAVVLQNSTEIKHKETVELEKEKETSILINSLFPGTVLTNLEKTKASFASFLAKLWK